MILTKSDKRLKVLLLSPPCPFPGSDFNYPLGIGYLVSSLKPDRPVEALYYQRVEHLQEQFPLVIEQYHPDIIGLSCTTFNRGTVRSICKWLRKTHPYIQIVLGGVHASFMYEQVLRDYGADFVVIGEGEITLRELCNALECAQPLREVQGIAFLEEGQIVKTTPRPPVKDLDELPMPDYSFATHMMGKTGLGFVISSRGCPVRCSFCSTSSYWGQKVRMNSVRRTVDEIEVMVRQFGLKKIFFYDDTFNLGLNRVREFCNEISSRNLGIEWGVSCRVHPVSPEMIEMMVEAGCRHICWGIESGSKEMLQHIDKKITQEQIRTAFEICRPYLGKISVGAFAMVGNPGESETTIAESVNFINTISLTDQPSTAILYILPGTKLYAELLPKHPELEDYWVNYDDVPLYTFENSYEQLNEWSQRISCSGAIVPFDRSRHFWNDILFGNVPPPSLPDISFLQSSQKDSTHRVVPPRRLRLLLVYAIRSFMGHVTLPEWIKETLREHYADQCEVFACGPGNEIDLPDGPDFYGRVATIVDQVQADVVWDIEGGADSIDFMFRRFPVGLRVPKVFWAIDTHQFLKHQVEKAAYFDLVFSAQKNAVAALGLRAEWLPAGASLYEKDYGLERTIDVGFIGNIVKGLHDRRLEILTQVQAAFPQFSFHTNVFLEEKAKLASQMKIIVNVSLNNDINFRVFETLACGALLLTDTINDNGLEDLFEADKHLVTFDNAQDLIHKIRYYLEHDDERRAIAAAGQQRVLARFTHRTIVGTALERIRSLLAEFVPAASPDQRQCWCHGPLRSSIHPLYLVCSRCGTHVSKFSTTTEDLEKFYSLNGYWREYQEKLAGYPPIEVRAVTDFSDRIPHWFSLVSRYTQSPESMLEIGCSHGGFLAFCRQQGIETVVGVEVDEATCRFAREHFKLPHVVSGLFPAVDLPLQRFDLITGFDVIEHFSNPQKDIAAIARLLSPCGVFIFQTPCYRGEDASWQQFKAEEHLYLFNADTIKELFDRSGLEITEILPGFFADDMFVVGRRKQQPRILFLRTDAIGDNILASGMLRPIKEHYPDHTLMVICQDYVAQLYTSCPYVDEIFEYNLPMLLSDQTYQQAIASRLKSISADILLDPVYSRDHQNYFLALNATAPIKIACDGDCCNFPAEEKAAFDAQFTQIVPNDPALVTELSRNRHFLQGLGIVPTPLTPEVWIPEADRNLAAQIFAQLKLHNDKTIVVFPGTIHDVKLYSRLTQVLANLRDYTLLFMGSVNDKDYCDELSSAFPGRSYNLAGLTTLTQAAAIMEGSRLYFGIDTSGAHIACAVGLPNVVILGGGHFGRFQPYSPTTTVVCAPLECYRCNWRCPYSRYHCIQDIRPDVVISSIKLALAGKSAAPRIIMQQHSLYQDTPGTLSREKVAELIYPGTAEILEY